MQEIENRTQTGNCCCRMLLDLMNTNNGMIGFCELM